MRSVSGLVARGMENPERIPPYVYGKLCSLSTDAYLQLYRRKNSIPRQKRLIHRFIEQEEFAIIILDACRYDVFSNVYEEFLEGELSKVWSSGRWTKEYAQNTWEGNNNLTYINTAPVISDFYFSKQGDDLNPENFFEELIPVWETHWDPTTYTVPAEKVTDTALSLSSRPENTRLVAHYMQPHLPYVGDEKLNIWKSETNPKDRIGNNEKNPTDVLIDAIESDNISTTDIEKAYISNLEYVLLEVCRLIQNLDCPIVVTSDHGENLGENGRYFHEHNTLHTRLIPWLVVDSNVNEIENENTATNDQENVSEDIGEDVVQNRLKHLGYSE